MASSVLPAVSAARKPVLPAWNNPTVARAQMATATTTSSNEKPAVRIVKRSARIGGADASAQPVDPDIDRMCPVIDRDTAAGTAAVRVEADSARPFSVRLTRGR